jgi:hypothetical protein
MRKTAVEWLIDMLVKENELTLKGENYKLFEIAKQMENEQIIDAYETSHISMMTAKQYYSETFNKEIPRLFHYLPKVYTKHCEKAVNMAVNIRKKIKKLLKNY